MGLSKYTQAWFFERLMDAGSDGPVVTGAYLSESAPPNDEAAGLQGFIEPGDLAPSGDPSDPYVVNTVPLVFANLSDSPKTARRVVLEGHFTEAPSGPPPDVGIIWHGRIRDKDGKPKEIGLQPFEQVTFGVGSLICRFEDVEDVED